MGNTEAIAIDKKKLLRDLVLLVAILSSASAILCASWQNGLASGDAFYEFLFKSLYLLADLTVLIFIITALQGASATDFLDGAYYCLWRCLSLAKLFDSRPGLLITDSGIVDNTSVAACGEIPWDWITGIDHNQESPLYGIALYLSRNHADTLIGRRRGIKRWLLLLNRAAFGTPVFLCAGTLKTSISRDELTQKLNDRFQPFRERHHESDTPREEYLVPYVEHPTEKKLTGKRDNLPTDLDTTVHRGNEQETGHSRYAFIALAQAIRVRHRNAGQASRLSSIFTRNLIRVLITHRLLLLFQSSRS